MASEFNAVLLCRRDLNRCEAFLSILRNMGDGPTLQDWTTRVNRARLAYRDALTDANHDAEYGHEWRMALEAEAQS